MEEEPCDTQTEIDIKEDGEMECEVEMGLICITMAINMWVSGLTIEKRARGPFKWKQEILMLANGKIARSMAKVYTNLVTRTIIRDNS